MQAGGSKSFFSFCTLHMQAVCLHLHVYGFCFLSFTKLLCYVQLAMAALKQALLRYHGASEGAGVNLNNPHPSRNRRTIFNHMSKINNVRDKNKSK